MLRRLAHFLAGLLAGLLAAGLLLLLISRPRGQPVELLPPPTPSPLRVHVAGAVARPGVYALQPGAIVQQALEAAGGAAPDAALEALNQAAPLEDGQQIVVPSRLAASASPAPPLSTAENGRLNINTATPPELDRLPGIGPSLAQEIAAYREAHGPFQKIEDLLLVPGIGPAKLALIKDLVTVR